MARRLTPLAAAGLLSIGVIDASLLAGLIQTLHERPAAVAPTEWKPNVSAADEAPPASRAIGSYEQVLAHPLFFKTREPFVPAPPPLPPPPPPRPAAPVAPVVDPGISVAGVLISGPIRKAYLVSNSNQDGTWVREGDEYNGWKVQSVTAGTAKLLRDDRLIELPLYPKR
jgi:hypothetical protein